ncbi:uncharacterized protein VICG_00962 [Vittaforma corneae ATCC 50505]|uniref:Uncharacterized protein n=1 Tax=Vittaforma corneae (strain ATCC 50505) TaxID=993615 RepID=L2GN69_VITCO|nr:uncharacterized protein VICG_00962 [Vittaforma corneae ATCC 50505]ELA41945.1 hypothetical protein VICG_00962 [Vittaforma corneae ATCC 50505]
MLIRLLAGINITYITFIECKDALENFSPDKYDLKMSKLDSVYANQQTPENDIDNSVALENEKMKRFETQVETLKGFMDIDNLYPVTSRKLWEAIYKFIIEHLKELVKDGRLGFTFYIRYNFCLYIIPLLPTEYVLVFPSFYHVIIPEKVKKYPLVLKFLTGLENFLKLVKKKSKVEVLPAFMVSKTFTSEKDIEIIKQIPDLIRTDPFKIIKWLIDFKIEPIGVV